MHSTTTEPAVKRSPCADLRAPTASTSRHGVCHRRSRPGRIGLVASLASLAMLGAGCATRADAPTSSAKAGAKTAADSKLVRVMAAGSLRAPLDEIVKAFQAEQKETRVQVSYGPSGELKDRILSGTPVEVFASANMEHPQTLVREQRTARADRFAVNSMCLLARPGIEVRSETVANVMLDPAVKVGTSTPKADPSGDYAWQIFDRIGSIPGATPASVEALKAKALQLVGGPNSPTAPAGTSLYGKLLADKAADVFLTYCTNGIAAQREYPQLQVVRMPSVLDVGAEYGLSVMSGAPASAIQFANYVLGTAGQSVLAKYGFGGR